MSGAYAVAAIDNSSGGRRVLVASALIAFRSPFMSAACTPGMPFGSSQSMSMPWKLCARASAMAELINRLRRLALVAMARKIGAMEGSPPPMERIDLTDGPLALMAAVKRSNRPW
eukprot:TRINITY_DN2346_c0_g1_i7.p3 TRINITY_DN2346_c0_g1~~TRINITY_DN2346_c0_g1_i7.p3  ORF type:complete len:115 (-),score=0.57 TRINITY_DN2346_c0_g1_i7:718-1062(-)